MRSQPKCVSLKLIPVAVLMMLIPGCRACIVGGFWDDPAIYDQYETTSSSFGMNGLAEDEGIPARNQFVRPMGMQNRRVVAGDNSAEAEVGSLFDNRIHLICDAETNTSASRANRAEPTRASAGASASETIVLERNWKWRVEIREENHIFVAVLNDPLSNPVDPPDREPEGILDSDAEYTWAVRFLSENRVLREWDQEDDASRVNSVRSSDIPPHRMFDRFSDDWEVDLTHGIEYTLECEVDAASSTSKQPRPNPPGGFTHPYSGSEIRVTASLVRVRGQ